MKAFPCWALVTGFTYLFGVTYLPAKQGGCVDIVLEPGAFRGFHWSYDITFSFLFLVLCGRTRQAMNSLFCCSDVLIKMNSWNIVFWVQSQVLSWDNKTSKKKKNFHHVFLGHVSYTCYPTSHWILFWGCYVSHISMYVLFNPLIQETLPCVFHAWYSQNSQKCAVSLNVLSWYSFPQVCLITKFSWVPP